MMGPMLTNGSMDQRSRHQAFCLCLQLTANTLCGNAASGDQRQLIAEGRHALLTFVVLDAMRQESFTFEHGDCRQVLLHILQALLEVVVLGDGNKGPFEPGISAPFFPHPSMAAREAVDPLDGLPHTIQYKDNNTISILIITITIQCNDSSRLKLGQ